MIRAPVRLVDAGWGQELTAAICADRSDVRIVCPFIKERALERLLSHRPGDVRVITRFNLADFSAGVSDVKALRVLLDTGASVRGIRNLHAKLYLFGTSRAIITSANLTEAALTRNQEFGVVADDTAVIEACRDYFDGLWRRGSSDLSRDMLDSWEKTVTGHRAAGGRPDRVKGLGDFGADAGLAATLPVSLPVVVADADQAFIKFLGEGDNRVPVAFATIEEIELAGCHWAVAYPATRRPRSVEDGAIMFIARLTDEPDIRIFGRAIGMKYRPVRDDASPEDIALRPWKEKWPRYVRVHHAEFVAGTMANGISLNELMDTLGSDSFAPTQRHAARGTGNTDPRRAYRQQAAVELSLHGISWVGERLQAAFDEHGKVPQDKLDQLDWPGDASGTSPMTRVATFISPMPITPEQLKGKSTVQHPVAVTWVLCLNATGSGEPPRRSALIKAAMNEGVTYYTAQKQVDEFLAWHRAGRDRRQLPRRVELSPRGASLITY